MKRISLLLILTAVLFVVVTCGDDNPVQPQDTPDEHLFYIAPMAGNMVRVFSVEREIFIDSMIIDSVGSVKTFPGHVELFNQPGGNVEGKFCNRSEVVSFVYSPTATRRTW